MKRSSLPAVLAVVFVLVFRLSWVYLRVQWRAKRSSKIFAKHLAQSGMPRAQREALTEKYRSQADLMRLLRQARRDLPF